MLLYIGLLILSRAKETEHITKRIQELFLIKKQSDGFQDNEKNLDYNLRLGWFLSVCERIAGYTLGDFEHSIKLATSNALALNWHPSVIIKESVKYFESLKKQENEMLQFVLEGIPDNLKNNFFNNILSFENLYEQENKIKNLILIKEIKLFCKVEKIENNPNIDNLSNYYFHLRNCIIDIYNEIPIPIRLEKNRFTSSLFYPNTILIILLSKKEQQQHNLKQNKEIDKWKNEKNAIDITDYNDIYKNESVIGYAKGGPIEKYGFRKGTVDENFGKKNTAFMECIGIRLGYWGNSGGHLLRMNFLLESKKRGYKFVTGYLPRNVIIDKIKKGEPIEIVKKYDPDELDYYRINLN